MSATTKEFDQALRTWLQLRRVDNIDHHLREDSSGRKSLYLRSLELEPGDMEGLTACFRNHPEGAKKVDSVSLSYNTLGDEGVVLLMSHLPSSVHTLGLVSCGVGDAGGQAILDWITAATSLNTVCIENNSFSSELRRGFSSLRSRRPEMLLVT